MGKSYRELSLESSDIRQGRDNKLHLYERLHVERLDGAAAASSGPPIQTSMDSNSLNFCRFALTPYQDRALMALPNLVDSELIDIYAMPSGKRLHSKINYEATAGKTETGNTRSGLVMAVALRVIGDRLALVSGYEDGRLEVWACDVTSLDKLWDGKASADSARPWQRLWTGKAHNEAREYKCDRTHLPWTHLLTTSHGTSRGPSVHARLHRVS